MQFNIKLLMYLLLFKLCFGEISKYLREYIESKNRLQKYTITTSIDYEKNQSNILEENLLLNLKGYVPISDSFTLKNVILNISVFELEYHEFDCQIKKNNRNESIISGYSIDLLRNLQDILHFGVQFNIANISNHPNISFEEILLNNNTSDLILCHPDINISLTEALYPSLESSYILIYKLDNLSFTEDIFILTFAGTLWLCFIIVLILLAISLKIATKQYNRIYGHPRWGSVEITFWAIATACQQGLSTVPYGFATRLIIFLGAMTAYLLYTGFAAGITSLVAVQNQNFEITIDDIKKMKLNVVSFGNLVSLSAKYNYLRNSYKAHDMNVFFSQLDKKNWIGVTLQIYLNQYFYKNSEVMNNCKYMITVITDSKHLMSNLVPKNSRFKKIYNYWYIRSRGHGIRVPLLLQDIPSCVSSTSGTNIYSSARLEHVRSAILVLVVGLAASIIFLLGECIWNGYVLRKLRKLHRNPSVIFN